MGIDSRIEIGVAQRPHPSETVCGDAYVVAEGTDIVDIGLADGLGHGVEASVPAKRFCEVVKDKTGAEMSALFKSAQEKLAGTRGAAAAVLRLHRKTRQMEYAAVGNVEIRASCAKPIHPISMPGVIGHTMKKLMPYSSAMSHGDLLIVFSDGIAPDFELKRGDSKPAQAIADEVLAAHASNRDDATCIVVRWHF